MTIELNTILTPRDHQQFLEHGYVLLKGLVPADAVSTAVALLEQSPSPEASETDAALETVVTDAVVDAVAELFGPRYTMIRNRKGSNAARKHEPLKHWTAYAHLDMLNPTLLPEIWAVGAFVFLTRVQSRGGGFLFAPGSPRRLAAFGTQFRGESMYAASGQESMVGRLEECLAQPGDVILFHHRMVHAGSRNLQDPTTRHAIRVSWLPNERIVPGLTPVDELSTIEKTNSIRWLRTRGVEGIVIDELPAPAEADVALAQGIASAGDIVTHDIIRYDGSTHLLYVDAAHPNRIQRRVTNTWVEWTDLEPLELSTDQVRSLHIEHRFDPVLTVVADTPASRSCVFTSADLTRWRQFATLWDMSIGRISYVHYSGVGAFKAKAAAASVYYFVPDTAPHEVWWRSGVSREELGVWPSEGQCARLPEGTHIVSVLMQPVRDASSYALIADVRTAEGIRTHYSVSQLQDDFEDQLQPLRFAGADGHGLRVFERGPMYWVVTFLRDGNIFWGTIDWQVDPGVVRDVACTADMVAALTMIGLQ